jgi:hypothetical protein
MNTAVHSAEKAPHEFVVLHVRYLAAHRPFVDDGASRNETLASLKPRVLDFFKLSEESGKTYTFMLGDKALTNLSTTLGELAEGKNELKLDLDEQYEQG